MKISHCVIHCRWQASGGWIVNCDHTENFDSDMEEENWSLEKWVLVYFDSHKNRDELFN